MGKRNNKVLSKNDHILAALNRAQRIYESYLTKNNIPVEGLVFLRIEKDENEESFFSFKSNTCWHCLVDVLRELSLELEESIKHKKHEH